MRSRLNNQEGFTLIEIIAVLILLGILAAVALPRYIDLTTNAEERAIQAVVAELNGRENMAWANEKLSTNGWSSTTSPTSEENILDEVDESLGDDFSWNGNVTSTSGTVTFKGTDYVMTREPSTSDSPGSWKL